MAPVKASRKRSEVRRFKDVGASYDVRPTHTLRSQPPNRSRRPLFELLALSPGPDPAGTPLPLMPPPPQGPSPPLYGTSASPYSIPPPFPLQPHPPLPGGGGGGGGGEVPSPVAAAAEKQSTPEGGDVLQDEDVASLQGDASLRQMRAEAAGIASNLQRGVGLSSSSQMQTDGLSGRISPRLQSTPAVSPRGFPPSKHGVPGQPPPSPPPHTLTPNPTLIQRVSPSAVPTPSSAFFQSHSRVKQQGNGNLLEDLPDTPPETPEVTGPALEIPEHALHYDTDLEEYEETDEEDEEEEEEENPEPFLIKQTYFVTPQSSFRGRIESDAGPVGLGGAFLTAGVQKEDDKGEKVKKRNSSAAGRRFQRHSTLLDAVVVPAALTHAKCALLEASPALIKSRKTLRRRKKKKPSRQNSPRISRNNTPRSRSASPRHSIASSIAEVQKETAQTEVEENDHAEVSVKPEDQEYFQQASNVITALSKALTNKQAGGGDTAIAQILSRVGLAADGTDAAVLKKDLAELIFEKELEEAALKDTSGCDTLPEELGLDSPRAAKSSKVKDERSKRRVSCHNLEKIKKMQLKTQRVQNAIKKLRATVTLFKHSRTDPDALRSVLRWRNRPPSLKEYHVASMHLPKKALIRLMMCCADVSARFQLDIIIEKNAKRKQEKTDENATLLIELHGEEEGIKQAEAVLRKKAEADGVVTTDLLLRRKSLHTHLDFNALPDEEPPLPPPEVRVETPQATDITLVVPGSPQAALSREELTYIACTIDNDNKKEEVPIARIATPEGNTPFKTLRERAMEAEWTAETDRGGSASADEDSRKETPQEETQDQPFEEPEDFEGEEEEEEGYDMARRCSVNLLVGRRVSMSAAASLHNDDGRKYVEKMNRMSSVMRGSEHGRRSMVAGTVQASPARRSSVRYSKSNNRTYNTIPNAATVEDDVSSSSSVEENVSLHSNVEHQEANEKETLPEEVPPSVHTPSTASSPEVCLSLPEEEVKGCEQEMEGEVPAAPSIAEEVLIPPLEVPEVVPNKMVVELRNLLLPGEAGVRRGVIEEMLAPFGTVASIAFIEPVNAEAEAAFWERALTLAGMRDDSLAVPNMIRIVFSDEPSAEEAIRHLHGVSILPGMPLLDARRAGISTNPPYHPSRKPKWDPGALKGGNTSERYVEGSEIFQWDETLATLKGGAYAERVEEFVRPVPNLGGSVEMYRERLLRSERMQHVLATYAKSVAAARGKQKRGVEKAEAVAGRQQLLRKSCGGMVPSLAKFAMSTTALGRAELAAAPRYVTYPAAPPRLPLPKAKRRKLPKEPYLMHPTQCCSHEEQVTNKKFVRSFGFAAREAAAGKEGCDMGAGVRPPIPHEWLKISETHVIPPSLSTQILPNPTVNALRVESQSCKLPLLTGNCFNVTEGVDIKCQTV